jgi:hypothetical protein
MEDEKPTWPRTVAFVAGAVALSAVIFALAFSQLLKGPAMTAAMFIWFVVFLAYTYFGSAWIKLCRIGPVMQRYRKRLAAAMMAYCVTLLGSVMLLKQGGLAGPLLWIVAVAPAIPILGVLAVIGLYIKEEPDEFERAIHVEAMLWGLAVVLAVSTVWGFLSNAGVVPAPPLFLIFPLFCAAWGLSQPFIRRRYQ